MKERRDSERREKREKGGRGGRGRGGEKEDGEGKKGEEEEQEDEEGEDKKGEEEEEEEERGATWDLRGSGSGNWSMISKSEATPDTSCPMSSWLTPHSLSKSPEAFQVRWVGPRDQH